MTSRGHVLFSPGLRIDRAGDDVACATQRVPHARNYFGFVALAGFASKWRLVKAIDAATSSLT
jgi:hypothetical protein